MSDLNFDLEDADYDWDADMAAWWLPTNTGIPRRRELRFQIDRLARRYLRYSFAISTAICDSDLDEALDRREALIRRTSRISTTQVGGMTLTRRYADELVRVRALQIIDPSRFGLEY